MHSPLLAQPISSDKRSKTTRISTKLHSRCQWQCIHDISTSVVVANTGRISLGGEFLRLPNRARCRGDMMSWATVDRWASMTVEVPVPPILQHPYLLLDKGLQPSHCRRLKGKHFRCGLFVKPRLSVYGLCMGMHVVYGCSLCECVHV